MTDRIMIAAMLLQGLLANPKHAEESYDSMAGCAYMASGELLKKFPSTNPSPAPARAVVDVDVDGRPKWWDYFIQNICELPDRTSPKNEPNAMVVTGEELWRAYCSAAGGAP